MRVSEKAALGMAIDALLEKRRRIAPQKAMYDDMQLPYHQKYSDEYERISLAIQILENLKNDAK